MIERERCTYIRTPDIYIYTYIIYYIYMYKRDAPHDLHIVVATYPHSFSHSARSYLCRRLDGFASLLCSTSAKDEDCPAKSGDAGTVTRRWSPNLIFGLISASKNSMSLCMYGCGSKVENHLHPQVWPSLQFNHSIGANHCQALPSALAGMDRHRDPHLSYTQL